MGVWDQLAYPGGKPATAPKPVSLQWLLSAAQPGRWYILFPSWHEQLVCCRQQSCVHVLARSIMLVPKGDSTYQLE